MGTRSDERWLTRDRAGYLVAALLVGAAVLGHFERRTVPADDIPLASLPEQIGDWTTVAEEVQIQRDGSYKMLRRTYENAQEHRVFLTVQATYTRAGSLRDWSLAMMADGYTPREERIWHNEDGTFAARVQRMDDGNETRLAVTWYASEHSQSSSFKRAQLTNWRDRLLGRTSPWASLYVVAPVTPDHDDEEALTALADAISGHLRRVLAGKQPRTSADEPLAPGWAEFAHCPPGSVATDLTGIETLID